MALSTSSKDTGSKKGEGAEAPAQPAAPAPVKAPPARSSLEGVNPWLVPIYAASLALVFVGERVLSTSDAARFTLTGLGVLGAVVATILRFVVASQHQGERREAERALAFFSALGLVALALYFSTTDTGRELLGVAKAAPEARARVGTVTTIAWVVLLVSSILPLFFGESALFPMRRAPRIEARRVRAATLSGLTLSLAVAYCALFTYAAGELDIKADFSYYRTARPSESTRKVAESLTEPVKVTAFFPQLNDVGAEVEGYLRDAARSSPNFQVEVHDRLLVPAVAKEAKVTQDGVIILSRGSSRETVTVGADMKTAAAKLKSLDVDFQKSLLKVIREQRTAYLTVGHGELNESPGGTGAEGRSAKNLRKLLESQNYVVKDLGLTQGLGSEIPQDAFLVVVLGPSKAFLPEEVAALGRYADRGGKLLLALDPEAKVDLEPLAAVTDLTWSPPVLATEKNLVRRRFNESDRAILVTSRFSSHASVSTLSKAGQRAPVILPGAAALDKEQGSDAKVDFVVRSMPDTFADLNGNFAFDKDAEKQSAYNLAAAVSKPASAASAGDAKGKEAPEMRAFVVGDADALSDAAFGHEPNIVFALDALRWLGGEESFSGAVATSEDVRIEHTKEKDQIWFWGTSVGAPLVVLAVGLFVTQRKRRAVSSAEAPAERRSA